MYKSIIDFHFYLVLVVPGKKTYQVCTNDSVTLKCIIYNIDKDYKDNVRVTWKRKGIAGTEYLYETRRKWHGEINVMTTFLKILSVNGKNAGLYNCCVEYYSQNLESADIHLHVCESKLYSKFSFCHLL